MSDDKPIATLPEGQPVGRVIAMPADTNPAGDIFGGWLLWLRSGDGADWSFAHQPWMMTKLIGVFLLAAWHGFLAGQRKKIAAGTSKYSGRFWRMTNEIPFVLAIIMVLSVTMEWSF